MIDFTKKPLQEISGNDDEVITKAKKLGEVGKLDILNKRLEELPFYKEYLRYYDMRGIDVRLPKFVRRSFDFDLLIKLIVASHSSTYDFVWSKNKEIRLAITVCAGTRSTRKYLDELNARQIAKMYNIYLVELIELELLLYEELERNIILQGRKRNLQLFYEKKAKAFRMNLYTIFA